MRRSPARAWWPNASALSGLKGYRTGGSIHFIVNNQIGFTTYPRYSRSSPYPSDVAQDDRGADLPCERRRSRSGGLSPRKVATEFRQKFQKPVVIDMFCYRRFGHNEGDEPAFTQPLMYKAIRAHPSTLEIYAKKLIAEGVVTEGEVEKMKADWRARLDAEYEAGTGYKPNKADWLDGRWAKFKFADDIDDPRRGNTGVALDDAEGDRRRRSPRCRRASTCTARSSASSTTAARRSRPAKASTGRPARRSPSARCCSKAIACACPGQDSERGTFSQRHSVLIDQESEARYTPLNHLAEKQGTFEVLNSMLSEEAVLGFEYGYTLAEPNALTLWEAQFGDFANGAQVVFDQFISSGERKWLRMSGLVLPAAARL